MPKPARPLTVIASVALFISVPGMNPLVPERPVIQGSLPVLMQTTGQLPRFDQRHPTVVHADHTGIGPVT